MQYITPRYVRDVLAKPFARGKHVLTLVCLDKRRTSNKHKPNEGEHFAGFRSSVPGFRRNGRRGRSAPRGFAIHRRSSGAGCHIAREGNEGICFVAFVRFTARRLMFRKRAAKTIRISCRQKTRVRLHRLCTPELPPARVVLSDRAGRRSCIGYPHA